ncbi:MAG: CRTAC1 family protein [bacterium]|nr:CRTAC1 family protein [bacterium]
MGRPPMRTTITLMVPATALLAVLAASGCNDPQAERRAVEHRAVFVDVAAEAGVTHVHQKPALDPKVENIMPWLSSVGASVAAGDYDDDGWIDLYVTNSRRGEPNFLYRNNGDGTFTDVAAAAGLADVNDEHGASMDSIWADLDDDGRLDLYIVRWGRDLLYRNNGDGTFRDVTAESFTTPDGTPGTPWANGNAVISLDYDLDGRLDLYVGNYFREVDLWDLESTWIMHDSFETSRNAGKNYLYRQQEDGTFVEVAASLKVDDAGWTLAVGAADLDNDGWPDIYVANDFGPDQLFYNDGAGGFVNVSETAIGYDTRKGMNVDFGDFNNDGWIDIYVTNITTAEYLQEGNMLWRNNGPGTDGLTRFMDISPESATYDGGWGWGAKFLDYDNDGDLDIFTVNGFISAGDGNYWYDLASWTVLGKDPADALSWPTIGDRSFSGYEAFRFWRNRGHETFEEVATEIGVDSVSDGRGISVVDYDNDGDLDIFTANQGQPPHLFRNDGDPEHAWVQFRLEGDSELGTRDAIGARVTLVSEGRQQIREREGGTGYSGQSDPRLHFGLGTGERIELVEIRWPDGGIQYLENVSPNRVVDVRQDPAAYTARSRVEVGAPEPRLREEAPQRNVPEISDEELEDLLSGMEAELRGALDNHALAHTYRSRAADYERHDRSIAFFREQLKNDPDDPWASIELSVALVDKIPTCGGLAAIVCKGTLARKSLDVLDVLVQQRPDWWPAYYGRGMNHLHWPRALRHSADAVADFGRCLSMQNAGGDPAARDYYERVYVLLGDSHAKNKAYDEARRVWREGKRVFRESGALATRAALSTDAEILAFVEDRRSLEQPIDTDFSFLSETR